MSSTDAGRNHIAIGFGGRELYVDGFLSGLYRCYQVGQGEVSIGACHQVDAMMGDKVVFHPLGHAAHYPYDKGTFFLQCVKEIQAVPYFLLGIVADGASVHKHGIGLVQRLHRRIAGHLHDGSYHLAVGHIHLAAVGLDKQFFVVLRSSCRFKVCFCS